MSVENLDIKITVNSDQAISKLNQVKSSMNSVGKTGTGGLSNNLNAINNAFGNIQNTARSSLNSLQSGMKNTTANTSTLGQSLNLFGNSLKGIAGRNEFSGLATGIARIIGTNSSLISGIGGTTTALAGMGTAGGGAFSGLISGATGLATALGPVTVGIGLIVAGLVGLAAWSVPSAVNAMEAQNAYDVKIGGQREEANKFADKMAGMGASRMGVKTQTANTYQQFRQSGQSQGEAIETSKQVIARAYDISSQENVDQATAVKMVQQSLTGEHERMKAIGVTITDNMVKQYAYNNLGAKRGKDLSQEVKLQAELGVLMQRTNYAKGDFAATQNSSANLARKVKNQWEEVKVTVGMAFEPLWNAILRITSSSIMPFLQDLADGFLKVARGVYQAVAGIWAGVKAIVNLENPIKAFKKAFDDAGKSFDTYSDAVKKRAMDAEADTDATNAETEAQKDLGKVVSDNIQSFDELHLIQKEKAGGSPGGGSGGGIGKAATVDEVTPSSGEKLDKDKVTIPIIFGPMPTLPTLPKFEPVKVEVQQPSPESIENVKTSLKEIPGMVQVPVVVVDGVTEPVGSIKGALTGLELGIITATNTITTENLKQQASYQELAQNVINSTGVMVTETSSNIATVKNNLTVETNATKANVSEAFEGMRLNANKSMLDMTNGISTSIFTAKINVVKEVTEINIQGSKQIQDFKTNTATSAVQMGIEVGTSVNALKNSVITNTSMANIEGSKNMDGLKTSSNISIIDVSQKVATHSDLLRNSIVTNTSEAKINGASNLNDLRINGVNTIGEMSLEVGTGFELMKNSAGNTLANFALSGSSNINTMSTEIQQGVVDMKDGVTNNTKVMTEQSTSSIAGLGNSMYGNLSTSYSSINALTNNWASNMVSNIYEMARGMLNTIKDLASSFGGAITGTINKVDLSGLKSFGNTAMGILAGVVGTGGVAKAVVSRVSSIGSALAEGANSLVAPIFVAPGTFENMDPNKKRQVPQMASGGIVSKATLALIGEGKVPEAVVPLEENGYLNKLVTNAVNTAITSAMTWNSVGQSSQSSTPINLVVNLDSKTIAQQTYTHLNDISNKNGTPLVVRR
jgi:hypothetical protein